MPWARSADPIATLGRDAGPYCTVCPLLQSILPITQSVPPLALKYASYQGVPLLFVVAVILTLITLPVHSSLPRVILLHISAGHGSHLGASIVSRSSCQVGVMTNDFC